MPPPPRPVYALAWSNPYLCVVKTYSFNLCKLFAHAQQCLYHVISFHVLLIHSNKYTTFTTTWWSCCYCVSPALRLVSGFHCSICICSVVSMSHHCIPVVKNMFKPEITFSGETTSTSSPVCLEGFKKMLVVSLTSLGMLFFAAMREC